METLNAMLLILAVGCYIAGALSSVLYNKVKNIECCVKLNKMLYPAQKNLINYYRTLKADERNAFVWWLYARSMGAHEADPLRFHAPIYSLPYQAVDQGYEIGVIREAVRAYGTWIDEAIVSWKMFKDDPEVINGVISRVVANEKIETLRELPYMFFDFDGLYARAIEEKV